MRRLVIGLIGVVGMLVGGCMSGEAWERRAVPYGVEEAEKTRDFRPVDLDGDGTDERVRVESMTNEFHEGRRRSVHLSTLDERVLRQVNFSGTVLAIRSIDLGDDGTRELVVPVVRNDSLFYHILGSDGQRMQRFFVASGSPREMPSGTLNWDPRTPYLFHVDVTGDARKELVSVLRTGFARQPRGVWIHALPDGELLGRRVIGAMPNGAYVDDVDDDPAPELLMGSHAVSNGATGGGMDDAHSYVMAVELAPTPTLEWTRQMGGQYTRTHLRRGDFDADGTREYLAYREVFGGRRTTTPMHWLDPATGTTERRRMPDRPILGAAVGDVDGRGDDELIVLETGGALRRFDLATGSAGTSFRLRERVRTTVPGASGVGTLPDLDGDGDREVRVPTPDGTQVLDEQFDVLAATPHALTARVVRRGLHRRPYLTARAGDRHLHLLRVAEQPLWWAYRYGPWTGGLLAVAGVVAAVAGGRRWLRRQQARATALEQILGAEGRAGLLVHPRDGVLQASPNAAAQLGLDGASPDGTRSNGTPSAGPRPNASPAVSGLDLAPASDPLTLDALRRRMPDLAAALDELAADGAARSRSASLSSARNEPAAPSDDGEETSDGDPGGSTVLGEEDTGPATLQLADGRLRATLVPLPVQRAGTPYVLVVLAPADRHRYEAWGRLAQRVAHDLKNPLTSILLSLQRMQMEYRTGDDGRDPGDLADTLDDYTTRIEERIATLRRMTTNVLKFVGEEKPRRTATNLSRFVAQHEDTLAEDLPPDIDLRLRLDDVPAAHVDQDQMQSVLDNLLTNAVEAMPGGGTITVSTYLAQDLYLDETHPQDYVVVEVLDTGTGMTEEEEERLFEPGFSTRDSTGLGLSIVRKIVHDHDGRIAVETEPEVGTGISIYLPAAE